MQQSPANPRLTYPLSRLQSVCGFASYGPEEYTGGIVEDRNFQTGYLSGEFALGTVGREDVTFAGLTVRNQEMSLVDKTHWESAFNLTSGIMGKLHLFLLCEVSKRLVVECVRV